jgi:pyruvate-formate lyase-activating enzyme
MYLAIMLTNKCTAFCPHCATCSSPKDRSLLEQERVYSLIDEACQLSKKQKRFSISFTGGEPFLYFDQLVQAVNYAHLKGAMVSVVTNGFWATSKEDTRDRLNRLKNAGLSLIALSCDLFHSQYVPFANIRRVIIETKEYGINIALKNTIIKGSPRAGDIFKELEDIIIDRSISIDEIRCLPLGRGRNIPSKDFIYDEVIPDQRCHGIGDFTITSHGDLYPCCVPDWPALLCLGNIYQNSLPELMEKAYNSSLLGILVRKGPSYFVPFLEKAGFDFSQKHYINSCHLCNETLKLYEQDQKAQEAINEALKEWEEIREKEREIANIILT